LPLHLLLATVLSQAAPSAAGAAAQDPPAAQPAPAAEALDADALIQAYEEALAAWAKTWYARYAEDQEARPGPSPAGEFWDRFARLTEDGDEDALLWQVRHLASIEAADDLRRERAGALFRRLRALGPRRWTAEAVPYLVALQGWLEPGAVEAYLAPLADDPAAPRALRRAARLARAQLLQERDPSAARALRVAAFGLGPREDGAAPDAEDVEDAVQAVQDAIQDGSLFPDWYVDAGGVYMTKPGAPPDPESIYRPVLEDLAELGSPSASLWFLTNTWPRDEAERKHLRGCLERFAAAKPAPEEIGDLAGSLAGLVRNVGAEAVETAVATLSPGQESELQCRLACALGEGLCESGEEELRLRGLENLRSAIERWPEAKAALRARGKVFRFENLVVGKPVPDFETVDPDGNAFKLSDYRGKVTVIDFWGFW